MFFELEKFAWKILIYYWPCFQKLPGSNLYYLIQHGSCKHLLMSTAINFCRITQVNKIFHFFPGSRSKTMMHFNWNRAIGVSRNYVKCYPFWSFPSETNIKQKKKKVVVRRDGYETIYSGQWNVSLQDQENSAPLLDPMIISVYAQIKQVDQHHAHDRCKIFTLLHL